MQIILWYSKTCDEGTLKKCPYMTGVPSSQVHFNVKAQIGAQKMQFRHPDRCPLVTGFTVVKFWAVCMLRAFTMYFCLADQSGLHVTGVYNVFLFGRSERFACYGRLQCISVWQIRGVCMLRAFTMCFCSADSVHLPLPQHHSYELRSRYSPI